MSLRARLAVLYTAIVGGILLLFGLAVYGAVSYSLTKQVDTILIRAVNEIWPNIFVDSSGDLSLQPAAGLDLATGILFQIWGRDKTLRLTNIPQVSVPLSPSGLNATAPVFQDSNLDTAVGAIHLRVLSVPLVVGEQGRSVGTLQVATSMSVVDATQQVLIVVLVVGAVIAMGVAGVAGWYSTRQALAPLDGVTKVALQITRADDLSRRIPYTGSSEDEVGQLITAFNQNSQPVGKPVQYTAPFPGRRGS